MEKMKVFYSKADIVSEEYNKWAKENNPIITRVLQTCHSIHYEYIVITVFYQEPINSPK